MTEKKIVKESKMQGDSQEMPKEILKISKINNPNSKRTQNLGKMIE